MSNLLVVLLLILPHGGGTADGLAVQQQENPPPIDGPVNDRGQATVTGSAIAIDLGDYYFEPTYIRTSRGASFTARLQNWGTVTHTFTIAELGIDAALGQGDQTEIQISMPARKQLVFVCRFHQANGMQGEFYAA